MIYIALWLVLGFWSCIRTQRLKDRIWRKAAREIWVIAWLFFPLFWFCVLMEWLATRRVSGQWMQRFEVD